MKPIEERLWEFIDGRSSADEKISIERLLQTDPAVKQLYEEFRTISNSLQAMELEEPSMRFTQNVMDRIALETAPKPLVTKIDKRIINVITGFFILTLGTLVIYSLTKMNRGVSGWDFSFNTPQINWSTYFGSAFIQGSLVVFAIIGLFAVDRYLQYRRHMHTSDPSGNSGLK